MSQDFSLAASEAWAVLAPDLDKTAYTAALRIRRAAIRLEAVLAEVLADEGFNVVGDFQVAALLARSPPLRPTTIATELRVTKAGVTGRLGRLERRGFVRRLDDPSDSRAVLLTLTPLGRRRTVKAVSTIARFYSKLFSNLERSDVETLESALGEVLEHLRRAEQLASADGERSPSTDGERSPNPP